MERALRKTGTAQQFGQFGASVSSSTIERSHSDGTHRRGTDGRLMGGGATMGALDTTVLSEDYRMAKSCG